MDADADLPAALRVFLYSCIDSVDQVDLLARLRHSHSAQTVRQLSVVSGFPGVSLLDATRRAAAGLASIAILLFGPRCSSSSFGGSRSIDSFLLFALAFAILTIDYAILGLVSLATEWRVYVFALRLVAFALIVFAIGIKNAPSAGSSLASYASMDRVVLRPRATAQHNAAAFVDVSFLPSRGMSLYHARARLSNETTVDVVNSSLSFAGAILLPFANRIRGQLAPDGKTIETSVLGRRVRLPANWRGQRPGAEQCAMHGLMFDMPMRVTEVRPDFVAAMLDAGNFNDHWPSRTLVHLVATLNSTCLELSVTVQNTGRDPLPIGIGWHPYFAIPSGKRRQARLHIPAARRACVTNYDDVFPTGELVDVAGTPYDFRAPEGAPLGTQYFDDMFVDLDKTPAGHTRIELRDPACGYHMRLTALSRHVSAVQLYAPPDGAFAVIEPQFNWADPFSDIWPAGVNTGMVVVHPDNDITWAVRWELL